MKHGQNGHAALRACGSCAKCERKVWMEQIEKTCIPSVETSSVEKIFPVAKIFPMHIREALAKTMWQEGLEEIRVRVGQPVEFYYDTGTRYLTCDGRDAEVCYRASVLDIAEMVNYISNYSLYAYKEELRQGYITIEGGHRIGLAGSAVTERGKMVGLAQISFLNIRIAHEKKNCASEILPYIRNGESIHNTLFVSEPGAGKTTFLRDAIRLLSEGSEGHPGLKVCVVDERSEIAACHLGVPQNDMGPRTDVLCGCGKSEGMQLLLRAMSPQVLAVDELGEERDFLAVEQAVFSGSRVLGTIHAGDVRELREKPYLRGWLGKEMFGRYIQIVREPGGARGVKVYDAKMEMLCESAVEDCLGKR